MTSVPKHSWAQRPDLLAWYDEHRRDLPFRDSGDAYAVWVSEIMLQQTRVDTVVPYFERWMGRFPDVQALAKAPSDDVMKAWEGLGYYSRARNLHAAARLVSDEFGGRLPDTAAELRKLPGVGPYTAGAIASIAFEKEEPVVDGNVIRVLTRLDGIRDDVTRAATRRAIWERAGELVVGPRPGDLNQALMELGATVCTPTSPKCLNCPLCRSCVANRDSLQSELPNKPAKTRVRREHRYALALASGDRWLIAKRPETGLLANLWEFPLIGTPTRPEELDGVVLEEIEAFADITHVFSHIRMTLTPIRAHLARQVALIPDGYVESRWVQWRDLQAYALSRLAQKVVEAVASGQRALPT